MAVARWPTIAGTMRRHDSLSAFFAAAIGVPAMLAATIFTSRRRATATAHPPMARASLPTACEPQIVFFRSPKPCRQAKGLCRTARLVAMVSLTRGPFCLKSLLSSSQSTVRCTERRDSSRKEQTFIRMRLAGPACARSATRRTRCDRADAAAPHQRWYEVVEPNAARRWARFSQFKMSAGREALARTH